MKRQLTYFQRRKQGLFMKLFIPLLIVMIVPVLLLSFINFKISRDNLYEEVGRSNVELINQTRVSVDNILLSTENITRQLIVNPDMRDFLNQDLTIFRYDDTETIYRIMEITQVLMEGTAYIENIFIYSTESDLLVSSLDGIHRKITNAEKEKVKSLGRQFDSVWIEPLSNPVVDGTDHSLQFLRFLRTGRDQYNGFILIQLKNEELLKLIQSIYIRESGTIFVVNGRGEAVINSTFQDEALLDSWQKTHWQQQSEGIQITEMNNNQDILLSFTSSRFNDWKYVAAVPANELKTRESNIGWNILLICTLFTGIALVLALSMARGLYNPILALKQSLSGEETDQRKLKRLALRKDEIGLINAEIEQMKKDKPELLNYFLYRIASGQLQNQSEIKRLTKQFGLKAEHVYTVVLIQLEMNPVKGDFSQNRLDAFRVHLLELFVSGMKELAQTVAFYEQADTMAAVLHIPPEQFEENFQLQVKQQCESYQQTISKGYGTLVSITIGKSYKGIEQIHASYADANDGQKYKFILGSNKVITNSEIPAFSSIKALRQDFFEYIRNALYAHNFTEANRLVTECKHYLQSNLEFMAAYPYYYRTILQTLQDFLASEAPYLGETKKQINKAFLNLEEQFQDIDSLTEWIKKRIEEISRLVVQERKYSEMIEDILLAVEKGYHKDISLNEMAEKFKVSSSYVSRVFKEEMGKNFKEYLTEKRLQKAKTLLQQTDLAIEQIAIRVGYNNYLQFARMFKKYEAISAQEYRNLHK